MSGANARRWMTSEAGPVRGGRLRVRRVWRWACSSVSMRVILLVLALLITVACRDVLKQCQ